MADRNLSVTELAERLDVSEKTVRRMIRDKRIPHSRIGVGRGAIKFTPKQVDKIDELFAVNTPARRRRSKAA